VRREEMNTVFISLMIFLEFLGEDDLIGAEEQLFSTR
jgi:hypothetical protein